MEKPIDLKQSVHDLIGQYPELRDILYDLGFVEIVNPAMLNTLGRMMNLQKGSAIKNIPMETIVEALKKEGFLPVLDELPDESRTVRLKGYLERLSNGEDLESVRQDFAREFSEVEASEIMAAEQDLLLNGLPLKEVQRLCDVHSALFHDDSLDKALTETDKNALYQHLSAIKGHPLNTLRRENEVLSSLLEKSMALLKLEKIPAQELERMRDAIVHYKKKGDLLYPILKVKYGIPGPHQVMWTVDDEIRDDFNKMLKKDSLDALDQEKLMALLERMKEMVYKEENILYPILSENLSEEDWKQIYQDGKDYAILFGLDEPVWEAAEKTVPEASSFSQERIVMPGGNLTLEQLECMLNTLPIEITFVDAENINCYFNEGPKVFKRPLAALGREVFDCHPPKVEKVVRQIIDDLRNHRRQNVAVWMEKEGKPFLVDYRAVLDRKGDYLGTVEIVQDMSFAQAYFDKVHAAQKIREDLRLQKELDENPSVREVNIHDYK